MGWKRDGGWNEKSTTAAVYPPGIKEGSYAGLVLIREMSIEKSEQSFPITVAICLGLLGAMDR